MLRVSGALGITQLVSAFTYKKNTISLRSVFLPAKVTYPRLCLSNSDLISYPCNSHFSKYLLACKFSTVYKEC